MPPITCPNCRQKTLVDARKTLEFRRIPLGEFAIKRCTSCGETYLPSASYEAASDRVRDIVREIGVTMLQGIQMGAPSTGGWIPFHEGTGVGIARGAVGGAPEAASLMFFRVGSFSAVGSLSPRVPVSPSGVDVGHPRLGGTFSSHELEHVSPVTAYNNPNPLRRPDVAAPATRIRRKLAIMVG